MSSAVVVTGALRVTIQTLLTLYIRVLKFEEKKKSILLLVSKNCSMNYRQGLIWVYIVLGLSVRILRKNMVHATLLFG